MTEQYDWDDTALLEAYDAAVKGKSAGQKKNKRQRPTVVEEEEEEETIPAAPHLDQVKDPQLQQLLQAYFNAGFALAQYMKKS